MRLTIRLLGIDWLDIYLGPEPAADDQHGDALTTPIGFTARWELPDGAQRPEWE